MWQREEFLNDHFKSVVQQILVEKKILLKLIGTDCDVSDVSANAVTVTDLKLVGPVLNTVRGLINFTHQ
jgi:hypothetical protein